MYVCNWLDPAKWKKVSFQGSWQLDRTPPPPITESDAIADSGAVGGDIEQGGGGGGGGGGDGGGEDDKNAEAPAEDTAAGLPSINNLVGSVVVCVWVGSNRFAHPDLDRILTLHSPT